MKTVEIIPPRAKSNRSHSGKLERIHTQASRRAALKRIDVLAQPFDTAFILPGGNVCFGMEALLPLVPGIGDLVAPASPAYFVV
jgi:hypothetical protein